MGPLTFGRGGFLIAIGAWKEKNACRGNLTLGASRDRCAQNCCWPRGRHWPGSRPRVPWHKARRSRSSTPLTAAAARCATPSPQANSLSTAAVIQFNIPQSSFGQTVRLSSMLPIQGMRHDGSLYTLLTRFVPGWKDRKTRLDQLPFSPCRFCCRQRGSNTCCIFSHASEEKF